MNTIEHLEKVAELNPWGYVEASWVKEALPDLLRVVRAAHKHFSRMPHEVLDAMEPLFREVER